MAKQDNHCLSGRSQAKNTESMNVSQALLKVDFHEVLRPLLRSQPPAEHCSACRQVRPGSESRVPVEECHNCAEGWGRDCHYSSDQRRMSSCARMHSPAVFDQCIKGIEHFPAACQAQGGKLDGTCTDTKRLLFSTFLQGQCSGKWQACALCMV